MSLTTMDASADQTQLVQVDATPLSLAKERCALLLEALAVLALNRGNTG